MQKKSICPWTWKNFWNEFFHSAPRLRIFLIKIISHYAPGLRKKNWITIFSLCSRTCLFFKEFVHYASGLEIYSCTKISSPCLWTWKKFLLQFISLCPWTWKVFWKCSLFTMPLDLKNFLEVFFSCYAPRLRIFLYNNFSPCLELEFFFTMPIHGWVLCVCTTYLVIWILYFLY